MELIRKENIRVQVEVENWQEAIKQAGELLLNNNSITDAYITEMVNAVEEMGPYIVIAPHIALAHARPSEKVLKKDISVITLKNPVEFGSQHNDPVNLVFAFCATESDGHLEQLTRVAGLLDKQEILDILNHSNDKQEVYTILNKNKGEDAK